MGGVWRFAGAELMRGGALEGGPISVEGGKKLLMDKDHTLAAHAARRCGRSPRSLGR